MKRLLAFLLPVLFLAACQNAPAPTQPEAAAAPGGVTLAKKAPASDDGGFALPADAPTMDELNDRLAAAGAPIRVAYAEYVTPHASQEAGRTVFANDRQLRLSAQWASNDPNRSAGDRISYMNIEPLMFATGPGGSFYAGGEIDDSFTTWDGLGCSSLEIFEIPWDGGLNSIFFGGGSFLAADVIELGFIDGSFFDAVLGPGARDNVLGVTFTFIWVDSDTGVPTDFNGDGFLDVALKEIWYNDDFPWSATGATGTFDVETVAFHENGHALGFGHFGAVFVAEDGTLHIAPRAAMNAFIFGVQRTPLGTDEASFCSVYGSWPS